METQKVIIQTAAAPATASDRAEAKGVLSPPPGMPAIERVLLVTGFAAAEAKALSGAFSVSGQVTLLVLYQEGGRTHGFTSAADFSREVKAQNVQEDSPCTAFAHLEDIHFTLEGGAVSVRAAVSLRCLAGVVEAVSAVESLPPESETRFAEVECRATTWVREPLSLRDDLRLPRAAAEILGCQAFCRVGGVSFAQGNAAVNGQLHLSLLISGMDGGPEWLPFSLPFEAAVPVEGMADELSADVALTGISAELVGDDTAEVDASVTLVLICTRKKTARVLADAYSAENELVVERRPVAPCRLFSTCARGNLRLEAPLPPGYPEAERVIFASLRPAVQEAVAKDGEMRSSGNMAANILYRCAKGDLYSFEAALPFEAVLSAPMLREGMSLFVHADAECTHASGAVGAVVVQCVLDCTVIAWEAEEAFVVSDVRPGKNRGGPYGPVVYFPEKGETPWDVGCRFGVPLAELARLNPGADQELPDAVLLNLRRKAK